MVEETLDIFVVEIDLGQSFPKIQKQMGVAVGVGEDQWFQDKDPIAFVHHIGDQLGAGEHVFDGGAGFNHFSFVAELFNAMQQLNIKSGKHQHMDHGQQATGNNRQQQITTDNNNNKEQV